MKKKRVRVCLCELSAHQSEMDLAGRLGEAFFGNSVHSAAAVIVEEKSSASLVDRLDEVASRELQKNEFKNVTLILRAIEQVIFKDEDCINRLVRQGVVIKMSMMNWFERISEHLKTQQKPTKASVQLMEVFYEVCMSLCQSDVEGNSKILEILLLRFGAVVIDREVKFELRLEAIKTMNSMLDSASKGARKNIYECDDYDVLLEDFAKVIVDVGDYEMQVAVSEALCRMTSKKQREELVGKWFNYRSFASTFTTITVKEFETDCRIFLNELNGYFGDSKRVFSFPCTRAFLDFTELFKPEDELLKEFWVDFNVGTSCISFFVHDPVGTLWERIYLPKESLCTYSLRECDERKLLNVHMSDNISHGNTVGKMVQIAFDSKYDIQTAVEKVFGKSGDSPLPGAPKNITPVPEDSGILADDTPKSASSADTETAGGAQVSSCIQSGPGSPQSPKGRRIKVEDTFSLSISSDTEVTMSEIQNHSFFTAVSAWSHDRNPDTITFMAALRGYQVMRAKAIIFGQSGSSNGSVSSVKSLPSTMTEMMSVQKRKLRPLRSESDSWAPSDKKRSFKEKNPYDYSRKKTRLKSKLKVLPLSSPSSNEEYFKESTPKGRFAERIKGTPWLKSKVKVHLSRQPPLIQKDNCGGQPVEAIEEDKEETLPAPITSLPAPAELPVGSEATETQLQQEEKSPFISLKPRTLFPSTLLERATETMTQALVEDEESEMELGSGVIAAFNTFKAQLREHYSSRYRKIKAKSQKSTIDCQRSVTSLLITAHNQRLVHLKRFQDTVVQQLQQLKQNCVTLKNIEQETVRFWQLESDAVKAFCDKQQKRLDSLDIPKERGRGVPESAEASTSVSASAHTSRSAAVPVRAETGENQKGPSTVTAPTALT